MERSPYKKGYFKKQKKSGNVFIILGAVLFVWLAIMIVMSSNKNKRGTEVITSPKSTKTPIAQENLQDEEDAFPENESEDYSEEEDDEEKARIRAEIAKVIEDINKKIVKDNQSQGEDEVSEEQTQSEVAENPVENKKTDTGKDKIIDKRRYYLTALYDMSGGVDMAVIDAYTSETRLVENVTGKSKVFLFNEKKRPEGFLRYTLLIYHNSGRIEGAVLDEYTGELRKITGLSSENPVRPFEEKDRGDYLRYSVSKEFIMGDIVLYFTDSFTSEVRPTSVQNLPDSINPFAKNQGKGSRRYFTWIDYIGTSTYCFCIDTYTSEIRMKTYIRKDKSVTFFDPGKDRGHLRYEGWCNWLEDGTIKIYALDTFTSEMRVYSTFSIEGPITLFARDRKDDDNKEEYRRYTGGVGYISGRGIISFAVDTFTGEIRIKTRDPEKSGDPIRYFNDSKRPGIPRYYAYIFYQLAGGVDIYVMDTFTSEIRIKTQVVGEQSLNLF